MGPPLRWPQAPRYMSTRFAPRNMMSRRSSPRVPEQARISCQAADPVRPRHVTPRGSTVPSFVCHRLLGCDWSFVIGVRRSNTAVVALVADSQLLIPILRRMPGSRVITCSRLPLTLPVVPPSRLRLQNHFAPFAFRSTQTERSGKYRIRSRTRTSVLGSWVIPGHAGRKTLRRRNPFGRGNAAPPNVTVHGHIGCVRPRQHCGSQVHALRPRPTEV
jgi:hypothetical protein